MLLPEVIPNRHRLKDWSEISDTTCYIYPVKPATEEELIRLLYKIRSSYKFDSSLSFDTLMPEAESLIKSNGGQIPKNLISYEYYGYEYRCDDFDDDGLEIKSVEQELRGLNEEKTTIENRIKEIQEYINKEN